jgi:subtilisin family serine protease
MDTEVIRVTVASDADYQQLQTTPGVIAVWADPLIAPFPAVDCNSQTTSTTSGHVAAALGATRIWNELGLTGVGMTIGIVDGGVNASLLPPGKVTGGWSPIPGFPPGSAPVVWGGHGDMCAFDALIASPDAAIHDYSIGRITGGVPALVSAALRAFEAARVSFLAGQGPHVLSNSWGLYAQSWDPAPPGHSANYSHNPNHPFNRKVIEVMEAGILVCFAAGNCGEVCPDGRCAGDVGPGRSIRGANGLPRVISVGAANVQRDWIGYSSQGPSTMDIEKPDVCGYSHFQGQTPCDSGTSAACPVVAGVLALMRQASPTLKQDQARGVMRNTAQHPEGKHWDGRYGRGIVDAYSAVRGV